MITKLFCATDATSDIADRLSKAITNASETLKEVNSSQLQEAQNKIEELRRNGFLKRQEYAAAKSGDFKKLFMRKR